MAEYIRRDDAVCAIREFSKTAVGIATEALVWAENVILDIVPSADVAEVVRCRDCKNNYVTTHNHGKQDDPRCDFTDRHLSLDDFCSRGKRRMDGGT